MDGVLSDTSQCLGNHGDALNPGLPASWEVGGELALWVTEASERVCCWMSRAAGRPQLQLGRNTSTGWEREPGTWLGVSLDGARAADCAIARPRP